MPNENPAIFYVYILFDECAIPRYVGKGKGKRFVSTLRQNPKATNHLKKDFIDRTRAAIGEVPAIKIRENLTEAQALEIEMAFIKAIGRRKTGEGPLTNLSEGGDGFTTASAKALHESRTPEQKKAVYAAISAGHLKHSPEVRSARAKKTQNEIITKEQRREMVIKANATYFANHTPEERSQAALRASLKVTAVCWINNGVRDRRINENDEIPDGWVRGRLNTQTDEVKISCIDSRWINDGQKTKRLKPHHTLPDGWFYGRAITPTSNSQLVLELPIVNQ